ncbi:MAG: GNAT family N-acetyltransferase [Acidobacteria bacterium]|nr:MAG: GNAT family N-acetyltransferase [Acidobacteriota bacterium]REK03950.1 MAG: GNAT family N-acetyltransferase [Acidobacteriota bacterium]REK15112.1 MAG: GNAT family N-acetyltransferase [Acidobacteriota bacterium]REK46202.1 MAG: GNAT family N-acetyltransferase [Acidobacteriota bacterium]
MPGFAIRIGTVDDAAALSEIGAETFWTTYRDSPKVENNDLKSYINRVYDEEIIRTELQDEGFRYLVAEDGTELAGYARLVIGSYIENIEADRPLEISRIYLLDRFQGGGRGKQLIERCLEEADRFLCDKVWLSVWKHNKKAIGFYEKVGFEKVGTTSFDMAGTEHEDWVMEKDVVISES